MIIALPKPMPKVLQITQNKELFKMAIPYKFNPLGVKKSSFDINKGLLFQAPLYSDFDAIGGTIYSTTPTLYGWNFLENYFGKPCVFGSSATRGIYYSMDNPIIGTVPFTIAIEYYILDITTTDNRSLFYIGKSTVNQTFGFEFQPGGRIGTAWGDDIVYDNQPNWKNYPNGWNVFVSTYDTQRIKIYINGELVATSQPVTLNIQKSTGNFSGLYGDLAIGSRWADGRYWRQGLRNNYIYDYALTKSDVKLFTQEINK